jgi:hypothetical protein
LKDKHYGKLRRNIFHYLKDTDIFIKSNEPLWTIIKFNLLPSGLTWRDVSQLMRPHVSKNLYANRLGMKTYTMNRPISIVRGADTSSFPV